MNASQYVSETSLDFIQTPHESASSQRWLFVPRCISAWVIHLQVLWVFWGLMIRGKKCVDYFKRRRRKRRSEMTKMPLAINRWSELSYYLETQTDVRFSREANASVFHDDSRKPVRKGNERKTWWCVTYSISGISLIGWVFAVFHGGGIFIKLAAADLSFNLTFVMITHVNFTVLGFQVCLFSHIACSLIRAFIDSQDTELQIMKGFKDNWHSCYLLLL